MQQHRRKLFLFLTLSQSQVKAVFDLLNFFRLLDSLQLVPQLPQLNVEVDFVLGTGELGTASTGRRHQIQGLGRRDRKSCGPAGLRCARLCNGHYLPSSHLGTVFVQKCVGGNIQIPHPAGV